MARDRGIGLYNKAKGLIPGGTQLLSKRPEMYLPDNWPSYYERCKGVDVWDLDGNNYVDMTIAGVGTCTLGYGDEDVNHAVTEAIKAGNMCTLNAPEEVELAELLMEIHPWVEMVRFARTGGEAMTVAIRIARAATAKEKVLFCGYHGWHDWYLSANLSDDSALDGHLLPGLDTAGVARVLKGTTIPFQYNDLNGFNNLMDRHSDEVCAVVMEPVRNIWPEKGFLEGIRQITENNKVILIFDEVTSGLRMTSGCISLRLGVTPDIAVLAKALGNGYPIAAIMGKAMYMMAAQRSFISSTYWTDRIGPAAAIATVKKHCACDVSSHLIHIGILVQDGWKKLAQKHSIDIHVSGIPPLSHWQIDMEDSQLLHTAIVHRMLDKGYLTSKAFYSTYAHTERHVSGYLESLDGAMTELVPYARDGKIRDVYNGTAAHSGFKRLT
ncbi:MAG: aminotransferase class III-fold pyridoxal phosphate-dependent enzyme [Nitrospirae bacterium]|nr:aminotransferase class III-fold pyridoxal phosphate-dependent enzyme [Nitrospirota bacterium]